MIRKDLRACGAPYHAEIQTETLPGEGTTHDCDQPVVPICDHRIFPPVSFTELIPEFRWPATIAAEVLGSFRIIDRAYSQSGARQLMPPSGRVTP
jgi:hypothetical protein